MKKKPRPNYIPLGKVPQWMEENMGITVSRHTAYDWFKRGNLPKSVRKLSDGERIKLKAIMLAGRYVTTARWLIAFFTAIK